ncbi:MAG: OprO/OprP family phosphate-selective porin [Candidatus Cloacimonetes bacterium]|nr:OprO/OprP family phosphate-selective porin [Candidatus Cloacimonadota bacterium]MCF7814041.1 OprO/OprP family phosphate-selective porin [Candidatus Cloacimonadota bacterium]MCF7868055.1 OprO/OprP family phosphate-selective porin [Candidatus Cloacimonadota bacterium]MCF7883478.1 OprO/OprP family phosphate-selective porin [Candidatus Cloacimonadota bacterium]
MKKTLFIVILAIVAFGILNAETKLKMELWNRWSYETIDGEVQKNEMALKRGYLRLEPKFTGKIKGRFNLDFFSDDVGDGVGMKLKYAYLDFSELIPVKNSKVTVGLMKTYFGTIYDWNYTTIEKDPSDKYKFVSSTDYGMGFSGYLPNGLGTYALAVYNGEGYKKTAGDINKDMNFLGNIRVTPIVGLTLGGSYMIKTVKDKEVDDGTGNMIDNPAREEYNMMAGVAKFAYGPFSVLGQYLNKVKAMPNDDAVDDVTSSVISVMPVFKVNNSFDIIARYDIYDPDTDTDDDGKNTLIAGVNYNMLRDSKNKPVLFVQANYETTTFEDESDAVNQILVQLRWIFSETINKK